MKENKTCKCGNSVELEYDEPEQEYPGAAIQGGIWIGECDCGEFVSRRDAGGFNVRENTRGW